MNKKVIISFAMAAAILGCLGVYGAVLAASTNGTNYPPIVQQLAEKFNLNVSEVQAFFDENQPTKPEPGKNFEAKLDEAVTNGEITADQKALIIAKNEELKTQREASREINKNLTMAERKTAMEAERTELKAWAEQNNIDLKYVMGGRGFGPGGKGEGCNCGCKGNSSELSAPTTESTK